MIQREPLDMIWLRLINPIVHETKIPTSRLSRNNSSYFISSTVFEILFVRTWIDELLLYSYSNIRISIMY